MESADEFSNENNTKASMTKEETSEHLEQSTGSGRRRQTTKNESGITLVPQPTDDPRDPLNWARWRKLLTLGIVAFAGFTGTLQAVGNVSSIFQQGALYDKTGVEITYSVLTYPPTSANKD
ncbi:hypothetical protein H2204_014895 [Knufia peltigerae]|uniref:Uncharacterized protein n=1 Tax=Knufia peltigerae TaxID=1002370 RepID=A0AA38XG07_9EURO|nr:hypothetical protein H2204_014895 [Knufia peltigerae]